MIIHMLALTVKCTYTHICTAETCHLTRHHTFHCMIELLMHMSQPCLRSSFGLQNKARKPIGRNVAAGRSIPAAHAGAAGHVQHAPKHNSRRNHKTQRFWPIFYGQQICSLHMRLHTASVFILKIVCTQRKANSTRCNSICMQGKANSARLSETIRQNHSPCRPAAAVGAAVLLHGEHSSVACHGNHCCHLSRAGW